MKKRMLCGGTLAVSAVMWVMMPSVVWAGVCSVAPPATVNVKVLDPAARIFSRMSLQQINATAHGHGIIKEGNKALGTTESSTEFSMSIKFSGKQRYVGQSKVLCMAVDRVNARFGNKKLVVNLPREYRSGTCAYNVVYRHEMAHVDVSRRTVQKYAMILKSELTKALKSQRRLQTSTMSRGAGIYKKRLNRVALGVTARFEEELKTLQGIIDAPGSPYAANGACSTW